MAGSELYDRLYPLEFELDNTDNVPIARTAPAFASKLRAPLYGVGVVLPRDWCRYKSIQLRGSAPHQPMGVWFDRHLIERAKIIGMELPGRLPRICDRNLRSCLITYQVNYRMEDMTKYVKEQEAKDFEVLCTLLDVTAEEKLTLKENWKWHRHPCHELFETDVPILPIPMYQTPSSPS